MHEMFGKGARMRILCWLRGNHWWTLTEYTFLKDRLDLIFKCERCKKEWEYHEDLSMWQSHPAYKEKLQVSGTR